MRILICGSSASNLDGWVHDALTSLASEVKLIGSRNDKTPAEYQASCEAIEPDMVYIPSGVLGPALAAEQPYFTNMLTELVHYTHVEKEGGGYSWAIVAYDTETGFSMDPCEDALRALSA